MEESHEKDRFDILVNASLAEKQNRVLKHAETFAVFDRQGSIRPFRIGDQGLYCAGTRYLSHLRVEIAGKKPVFLSSMVKEDNDLLVIDSANPDFQGAGGHVKGDSIHLFQSCFLWERCCYLRLRMTNYSLDAVEFPLRVDFAADYADIFEVRGQHRPRRGRLLPAETGKDEAKLGYEGLDRVTRVTRLRFEPAPDELDGAHCEYRVRLAPHGHAELFLSVACEAEGEPEALLRPYGEAFNRLDGAVHRVLDDMGRLESTNVPFSRWMNRSAMDLFMMVDETPHGMYPHAGIPWYSTVFGRDGILTALQTLWLHPRISAGVLRFLAAHQARRVDPGRDAEPGKILHEMRSGEMANLGEIPFGLYYGSVDSTPLFVHLAGRYLARTGDLDLIRSLWPNLKAALAWMDEYGDRDHDGFLEYSPSRTGGLIQQGWKDSEDSVFHANGELAHAPIALCEVQAYAYAAKLSGADVAEALGESAFADRLRREAESLRGNFQRAFWCADLKTYALALDGAKRPCRVRTSNAGQCLFTGIADEAHARGIVEMLLSQDLFSGWGVRTVAHNEARYNPISYHNGSVWPHDNALIAMGLRRYGYRREAAAILEGLYQASLFVDLHRLPELFCGFSRKPGEGPTLYPVACSPQAWASGSVYMLLEACLGLSVDPLGQRILFHSPLLPECVGQLRISGLRAGAGSADIILRRHRDDVGIEVENRTGKIEVVEAR